MRRLNLVFIPQGLAAEEIRAIDVEGGFAYIGLVDSSTNLYTNGAVSIVDLSIPASAREIAWYDEERVYGVQAAGDRLYSAAWSSSPYNRTGVRITDVSDPAHPQKRSFIEGIAGPLAARDNALYIADGDLYVYDVADPDAPQLRTTVGLGTAGGAMALAGEYLFVRCGRSSVCVLPITDPWNPRLHSKTTVPAADISKLVVVNDKLYVGSRDGLLVYDVLRCR